MLINIREYIKKILDIKDTIIKMDGDTLRLRTEGNI